MRVVMIGGTGFLGYFTCRDLVAANHEVVAVGLSSPEARTMPDGVVAEVCNADICDERELLALLRGADCVIHAAGADGRFSDKAPVIDAFRARNVAPIERLIPAMKKAGARNFVIFGSYYTALARSRTSLIDLGRNPYPLSRQEQMERAFDLAGLDLAVNVLELPYIFGGAPGRGTLWGYVMDKVLSAGDVQVPGGVTACVTADQVAAAARVLSCGTLAMPPGQSEVKISVIGRSMDTSPQPSARHRSSFPPTPQPRNRRRRPSASGLPAKEWKPVMTRATLPAGKSPIWDSIRLRPWLHLATAPMTWQPPSWTPLPPRWHMAAKVPPR